jgi:hypothetical protein
VLLEDQLHGMSVVNAEFGGGAGGEAMPKNHFPALVSIGGAAQPDIMPRHGFHVA